MAQSSAPEYAARHTPVREFNHAVTGKLVGSTGRVVPGGLAELCMLFHCNPRQRNPVPDAYGLHRSCRTGCSMWQNSSQHLHLLLRKEVCDANSKRSNPH